MRHLIRLLLTILFLASCKISDRSESYDDVNFKQEMRDFVINISNYAKAYNSDFVVIPQNGAALVLENAEVWGDVNLPYMNAIDAQAQEDFNYGYDNDNVRTPINVHNKIRAFLDSAKNHHKKILVTDYASSPSNISDAYSINNRLGYVGFVSTHRLLDNIPNQPVNNVNANIITDFSQVANFLYILQTDQYQTKSDFINTVVQTNYDLIIIDAFFKDGTAFNRNEIEQLRNKANGGKRKVVAYVSIGEAEDYRYYWKNEWNTNLPMWLDRENPNWQGNYKVKYWMKDWQDIIYGNSHSYIKKVVDANFDGAYLDIIDAFEYFDGMYN